MSAAASEVKESVLGKRKGSPALDEKHAEKKQTPKFTAASLTAQWDEDSKEADCTSCGKTMKEMALEYALKVAKQDPKDALAHIAFNDVCIQCAHCPEETEVGRYCFECAPAFIYICNDPHEDDEDGEIPAKRVCDQCWEDHVSTHVSDYASNLEASKRYEYPFSH